MDEFFDIYEHYRGRFNLKLNIKTGSDNRLRVWQQVSISDNRLIVDVTADNSLDMYYTATSQLKSFFGIFKRGVTR